MVQIKVFHSTPPCGKCIKTREMAEKVAKEHPGKVEVMDFPALSPEAEKYGVVLTPTTIVEEQVVATGSIPNEAKLEEIVKKVIEG